MAYRIGYRRGGGFNLGPIGFLIIINFLMWVATSIRPSLFIGLFGVSRSTFLHEPWTIITAMFIHQPFPSIWHILFNMLTLYFFGNFLLQLVGDTKFFITYFVGGIVGNAAFLALSTPFSVAIGASGAIFSLAGALTVMRPKIRVMIFPIPVPIPLWGAVIGFVALSFAGGIAWQAHIGGLLFGLAIGYYFRRTQKAIYFNF